MDDIENVYDEDTACQCPCYLDVNIAHQPEDIHESKVKDNIGTVRATREQFKQAGTNNSIPGFLFVHLGTKSFVPPVKVTNVRTIADVLNIII